MMSQWIMTFLCVHNMASQWIMTCYEPLLLCITTPNYDIAVSPVNLFKLCTYTIKINIQSIVVQHIIRTSLCWLCHTMACFEHDLHTLISCGVQPGAHYLYYFYVPLLIMMSQWIMMLLYVRNMASQWMMTFLWTYFVIYYYAKLWYCCFTSKLFKIVEHKPLKSISNQ